MRNKLKVKSLKLEVYTKAFYLLLFTFHLSLFTCLYACTPQKERVFRKSKILMDTLITITAVSDSSEKAEIAIDKAFSEIEKIDSLLNFFSDKSEVSEINRNAGRSPVRASPETIEVIEKAIYASKKTNSAFDVTIGNITALWDFHNKVKPEDKAIKEKLPLVNYKNIVFDEHTSSIYLKKKGMLIDLGGIAKGYAADKAAEVMKRYGIRSGLVSVAGDIKAFGLRPDGKPWKVGIRNPRAIPLSSLNGKGATGGSDDIMATIELTDMAISTSGDYERYFIVGDKRYHHILNPKTGYPSDECQSVSVIARDTAITDSLSTGIFVLGPKKGLKLLEETGINGIIVGKDGKIHITSNLRGKIEIIRD